VYSFSPSQFEQREVILMEVGGAEREMMEMGKGKICERRERKGEGICV